LGFSVTATGIIVIVVLLIAVASSITLIMKAFSETIKGIQAVGEAEKHRLESIMFIRWAVINTTDNRTVYFSFSNNGTLDYYSFDSFDLIISYEDLESRSIRTVRLEYNVSWWIINVTVNGDYTFSFAEKRCVEPSESAVVKAVLPSEANVSSPIKIVFVNQYGSRAIYKFVGGG